EIHWDLVLHFNSDEDEEEEKDLNSLFHHQHYPFSSLSPEIADITILLSAPSKTFNLPSLLCSYAIITNPKLKQQFDFRMTCNAHRMKNCVAFPAIIAAYTQCSYWVDKTRKLYRDNFLIVKKFFLQEKYSNLVDVVEQEATFLLFINFNKAIAHFKYIDPMTKQEIYPLPRNIDIVTGKSFIPEINDGGTFDPLNPDALKSFFFERIAVLFMEGAQFSLEDGDGWIRLNLATEPKIILEIVHRIGELLDQLEEEIKARDK
ncbi:MAG: Cystathionine beta-lyase, partial [Streblomastix strix]